MQPEGKHSTQLAVMLDLETLGTHPLAPVAEIGAVKFFLDGTQDSAMIEEPEFHKQIDMREEIIAGSLPDKGSIEFWMNQERDTQRHVLFGNEHPLRVLQAFMEWLPVNILVFSNGPHFDFVLINQALRRHGLQSIAYWRVRRMKSWAQAVCRMANMDYTQEQKKWKEGLATKGGALRP